MKINKIWFADNRIYGESKEGEHFFQSLLYYPRLLNADDGQRNDYEFNAFGIHWEELDEDVSFESFEYPQPEPGKISLLFLSHPELNASAVARQVGIQQSLLAAYINGTKQPSPQREQMILQRVREIGQSLAMV